MEKKCRKAKTPQKRKENRKIYSDLNKPIYLFSLISL